MEIEINQGILVRYQGEAKELILKEEIREIGEAAFQERYHLKKIVLPSSVHKIGNWAFSRCKNLTAIEIPTGVKIIGRSAFRSCNGLKSISIPDSVEEMQGKVFEFCKELKTVILPPNLTVIAEKTFSYCTNLESIEIPYGVKEIGAWAFEGCHRLKEIRLPETVEKIGECAFLECTSLEKIDFGSRIKEIGYHAFYETKWLAYQTDDFVVVNDILVSFLGRDSVVKVPESVSTIGICAFEDCRQVTAVILSKHVSCIREKAFEECLHLRNITLPGAISAIPDTAFHGCKNLRNLILKDFLTTENRQLEEWSCHDLLYQAFPEDLTLFLPTERYKIKLTGLFQVKNDMPFLQISYYDQTFDFMEELENKAGMAITRLLSPYRLTPEQKNRYRNFLIEHLDAILDYLVTSNHITYLRAMACFHLLEKEKTEALIQQSTERQQVEMTGFLLQFKQEEFGYEEEEYFL